MCIRDRFKSRLTDHYPGYTEVDATTGTIGDVTVKWNITPNDDNAYQNNLDATLLKQADAGQDCAQPLKTGVGMYHTQR